MLPNINQSQVNPLAGLTFESGLRSILRQDPDIVMIGETRDTETAKISIRSALTGHLVLSSLHTNDSVSAIVRLLDMGVEEYLLASSLVGIIAQRLVKKICPFCYVEYWPTDYELSILGNMKPETLAKGKGCHNCSNTGYKGRVAIHEILVIDGTIRKMISAKSPIDEVYNYVGKENKLKRLQMSLLKMVMEKRTTVEEMLRLTYFVN
jgi:type IV pilus assembly protein PilB